MSRRWGLLISANMTTGMAGLYRAFAGIVMVVLAFALAGCGNGGGSHPFAKIDGGPSGKTVPPIYLLALNGLPDSKLQPFKDTLSIAAGKRDMAIVDGKFAADGDGFGLSGSFKIVADPASLRLAYNWTLTDKAG